MKLWKIDYLATKEQIKDTEVLDIFPIFQKDSNTLL